MSHEARIEALIQLLRALVESDIEFVLVGGYAISQFQTRFSTDLDLVITPEAYETAVAFLEEREFNRTAAFEVPSDETSYHREIELFERSAGLPHPIGVELLVNGLGCRQTGAEWSFEYLRDHSTERRISGATTSTTAPTVDGEVLVAAKLHSARKTDLVDVLAAVPEIDFDEVAIHLDRGNREALRTQLADAQTFIEEGGLDHRYKSLFGKSKASAEDVDRLLDFLRTQQ